MELPGLVIIHYKTVNCPKEEQLLHFDPRRVKMTYDLPGGRSNACVYSRSDLFTIVKVLSFSISGLPAITS